MSLGWPPGRTAIVHFAAGSSRTAAQAAALADGGTYIDTGASKTTTIACGGLRAAIVSSLYPVSYAGTSAESASVAVAGGLTVPIDALADYSAPCLTVAGNVTVTIAYTGTATAGHFVVYVHLVP